jgi:hypothetical protein
LNPVVKAAANDARCEFAQISKSTKRCRINYQTLSGLTPHRAELSPKRPIQGLKPRLQGIEGSSWHIGASSTIEPNSEPHA